MSISKSYTKFCKRIEEIHGENEYEIKDYTSVVNVCTIKHRCGEEWTAVARNMVRGERCGICFPRKGGRKGKSHARFVKEVNEEFNGELEVISPYQHSQKEVKVKHICGYEYGILPFNLLNKKLNVNICVKCYNRYEGRATRSPLSNDEFILRFREVDKSDEFELLSGYENCKTEVVILHKKCGHMDLYFPNTFIDKRVKERCKNCKPNKKVTKHEFEKSLKKYGNEFTLLEYNGFSEKLLLKHAICNEVITMTRAQHFRGCCLYCDESTGERKVRESLTSLGVEFEKEYNKLNIIGVMGKPLYLDFYIVLNGRRIAIEYDGIFHYEKKHKNDGHENLVLNDKIKDEFCRENDIEMIRIPYWEYDNIKEILNKKLKPKEKQT